MITWPLLTLSIGWQSRYALLSRHLAQDAQHLFLIVPNSKWKQSGLP
jgi:hypothetical protein